MLEQEDRLFTKGRSSSYLKYKKEVGAKEGDLFCLYNFLAVYEMAKPASRASTASKYGLSEKGLSRAIELRGRVKEGLDRLRKKVNDPSFLN
jgi:hypothetical protein